MGMPYKNIEDRRAFDRRSYQRRKDRIREQKRRSKDSKATRMRPENCEVCGELGDPLYLDHCHETNKFRGWLCLSCNVVLGHAADDPKILRGLADYLESFKRVQ
jgi:hypothetical protein